MHACSSQFYSVWLVSTAELWLMNRDLWLLEFSRCSFDYLVPYLDQLPLELLSTLVVSTGCRSVTGEETAGF